MAPADNDYAEAILDTLQERSKTGSAETQAALRAVLREVAPERLLPPEPPVGSVLRYDGSEDEGKVLLVRDRDGYRRVAVNGASISPNPALDWRYVHKLPGLVRLVEDLSSVAPAMPWSTTNATFTYDEVTGTLAIATSGSTVLDINQIRSLAALCQKILAGPDPALPPTGAGNGNGRGNAQP